MHAAMYLITRLQLPVNIKVLHLPAGLPALLPWFITQLPLA